MATSKSKPLLFGTQKPFSVILAIVVFFLLLLDQVNSSDSLSFNFAKFGPDVRDIIFQGDALQSNGTLQLTKTDKSGNPVQASAGRALYYAPVHLWEISTQRLASFFTIFTFVIKPGSGAAGDGITFFIAPPESDIPTASSYGGFLALFDPSTAFNTSVNQIVAVEFDTYTNAWDPKPGSTNPHIGIDVNSIQSVTTTGWQISDVRSGSVATAQISYDSVSKNLRASLSYPTSENIKEYTLSYVVDLRGILPEWVRVGFSGSTGETVQRNNVLSWSFTSYLGSSTAKKKKFETSGTKKNIYVARSVI